MTHKKATRSPIKRTAFIQGRSAPLVVIKDPLIITKDGEEGAWKVRFGDVVVNAVRPSAQVSKRNIDAGTSALKRAKSALSKPGVKINHAPTVPLFHAHPERPGLLIRTLNGKQEVGKIVGRRFELAQC